MYRRTLFALAALVWLLPAGARAEELLVEGIAAQVGTQIVLISEVMQTVAGDEQRMRAAGAPELEIAKLRAEGLEALIERRLLEKIVEERPESAMITSSAWVARMTRPSETGRPSTGT